MEHTVEKNYVQAVARAGSAFRAVVGVTLGLLGFAVLAGCGTPTKPKEVKYNIYISATGWREADASTRFDQFYVYDADSLTLRDSIPLPTMAVALEVSPDGRWLYARCDSWFSAPGGTYKIDARTREVVWSIPGGGPMTLLNEGKVLMRERATETEVIDPADGHVLTHLPSSIRILKGPPNGTKVAAIVPDSTTASYGDTAITVFDVGSGAVYGCYIPRLSTGEALQAIYTARLHPDGKRVMVIGWYGGPKYTWFMVGDVETGETLLRHQLSRPFGEIAISEDGELAAVSDPSQPMISEGAHELLFFDLTTMKHLQTLGEGAGLLTEPSQIRFLLEDHKIAIAPTPGFGTGPFGIIDRATLTVEKSVYLPYFEPLVGALGVGPRP